MREILKKKRINPLFFFLKTGKISKNQLAKGFEVLEDLKKAIEGGKKGASINELSSKFYTAIPHDFGRKVPPPITSTKKKTKKLL